MPTCNSRRRRDEHNPKNSLPAHENSSSSEVVDVTGAGDTVLATLSLMIATGKSFEMAMRMANTAAGIAFTKAKTASVSCEELVQAFHTNHQTKTGLVELAELQQAIEQEKACGQKIVMTNGCFDVLHAGHIAYLEKTKALGDKLIVALNDDASIKRLKGSSRPYAPLASRAKVLAALRAVDWVIVFSEDTPLNLIKAISPDVLAKGADYKIADIVGADHVQSYGGKVVSVQHNFTDISSSAILAKMQEVETSTN